MARSPAKTTPTSAGENKPAGTLPHPEDTTLTGEAAAARDTAMAVIPFVAGDGTATGMYAVETATGESARVYLPKSRCDCRRFQTCGQPCRHLRRVAVERTKFNLPGRGDSVADYFETRLWGLRKAFQRDAREVAFRPTGRQGHPAVGDAVERAKTLATAVRDARTAWENGQTGDVTG